MVVFDSSAILAMVFSEPGREIAAEQLDEALVSAVSLGEVVGVLMKHGSTREEVQPLLDRLEPNIRDLTFSQAIECGALRPLTRHLGLSLGDRCCLALARELGAEVYTTDRKSVV